MAIANDANLGRGVLQQSHIAVAGCIRDRHAVPSIAELGGARLPVEIHIGLPHSPRESLKYRHAKKRL